MKEATIGGMDIRDLEWQTMRERIGMVSQDTWCLWDDLRKC
jgi:ABC-type multidrug transport system fused ATPase/permease subunit